MQIDGSEVKWQRWSELVPSVGLEAQQVLATDIVVPTQDTIRHRAVLQVWLAEHRPLILCAPPGLARL